MVFRDDPIHLGLLEHDLRDQDLVRAVRLPPGELAAVGAASRVSPVSSSIRVALHVPKEGRPVPQLKDSQVPSRLFTSLTLPKNTASFPYFASICWREMRPPMIVPVKEPLRSGWI